MAEAGAGRYHLTYSQSIYPNLSPVLSGGQVWMQPPDVPVEMDHLLPLVQQGRGPAVRTCLERRLKAMWRDRGKRFCR